MSRTLRRGKPTRNLHHYLNLHIIWGEYYRYCLSYPLWKDGENDPRPYEQYVATEIRHYHQDKPKRGLPRYVRQLDVGRQTRQHKRLIHRAICAGDYDVALTRMGQHASWAYC